MLEFIMKSHNAQCEIYTSVESDKWVADKMGTVCINKSHGTPLTAHHQLDKGQPDSQVHPGNNVYSRIVWPSVTLE